MLLSGNTPHCTSLYTTAYTGSTTLLKGEAAAIAVPSCTIFAQCVSGERFCILSSVSACRLMHVFVVIVKDCQDAGRLTICKLPLQQCMLGASVHGACLVVYMCVLSDNQLHYCRLQGWQLRRCNCVHCLAAAETSAIGCVPQRLVCTCWASNLQNVHAFCQNAVPAKHSYS
jgi:hypothetical protein